MNVSVIIILKFNYGLLALTAYNLYRPHQIENFGLAEAEPDGNIEYLGDS